ncbi:MAG: type II 3-dehydroquinate dehydratase [Longimicrobiales bacterium]
MKVAVLHGPNLNLLGRREPGIYGRATLAEIDGRIAELGAELGVEVTTFQSNGEGELIGFVQTADVDGFLVNAGGYTHTSVALLDALVGVGRPYVEVHLSNLGAREPFRRTSLLAPRASGIVMGFGADGYLLALRGLVEPLRRAQDGAPGA